MDITRKMRKVLTNEGVTSLVKKILKYGFIRVKSLPSRAIHEIYRQRRAREGEPRSQQHRHFKTNLPVEEYEEKGTDKTSYWIECKAFQHLESGYNSSVLELGCNVGRHLNVFEKRGYKTISGIDISKRAIDRLGDIYPSLEEKANLYRGSFEDVLPSIEKEFDVVYSVAVLMHLSDESEFIFDEISRICK